MVNSIFLLKHYLAQLRYEVHRCTYADRVVTFGTLCEKHDTFPTIPMSAIRKNTSRCVRSTNLTERHVYLRPDTWHLCFHMLNIFPLTQSPLVEFNQLIFIPWQLHVFTELATQLTLQPDP